MAGRPWTGPEIAQLKQLAAEGVPAMYLASKLGRTRWSIINKARELDIRLKYPTGEDFKGTVIPDHYVHAIRVLRAVGLTTEEISDIFKRPHRVSPEYVKRICWVWTDQPPPGDTAWTSDPKASHNGSS